MSSTRKIFLFVVIPLLIVFLIIGGYYLSSQKESSQTPNTDSTSNSDVSWNWNGEKWVSTGTPPTCETPLILKTPVDITKATSILYPGQTRGQYKPHGGFRFGTDNKILVSIPMDAKVVEGSRYIEGGEVQYLFEFVNDCGIAFRFDHLLTLTPDFQAIADKLPEAKADDSRTTKIDPVSVKEGDVIATEVGFKLTKNVGVDFGVYDYRKANIASTNSDYKAAHVNEGSQAFHAVCWLDMLGEIDSAAAKALPGGDSVSGKTSDYCN